MGLISETRVRNNLEDSRVVFELCRNMKGDLANYGNVQACVEYSKLVWMSSMVKFYARFSIGSRKFTSFR